MSSFAGAGLSWGEAIVCVDTRVLDLCNRIGNQRANGMIWIAPPGPAGPAEMLVLPESGMNRIGTSIFCVQDCKVQSSFQGRPLAPGKPTDTKRSPIAAT